MQKIILTHIFILISVITMVAQNQFSGLVVDALTNEPLSGATIWSVDEKKGTITDETGYFSLTLEKVEEQLEVSFIGYEKSIITANKAEIIIGLKQMVNQLNQVVVSANRDRQERAEAPVAIATIQAQELQDTRATSLEQVLNKVSGVHMVNLGNEQHSMSIRQPISYKSVFLYLEDGLPIRTSGVFNHNALIEINHGALRTVEIIRGPSSSLYGSEAIGGAINFITQSPSALPLANITLQGNNLGYRKGHVLLSNTFGKAGVLFSMDYAGSRNGYREHSDFDKIAFTAKFNYKLGDKTYLKNSVSYIDYETDMTGGLDSMFFYSQNLTSQQTFTYRQVSALRVSSKLSHYWSDNNKTQAMLFFRDNSVKQNPHYRIKDDFKPWTGQGNPNLAHSEINDNSFQSFGGIVQQQLKTKWLNAGLIAGVSADYSPNTYQSNYISVYKNDDNIYENYTATDSVLTDYAVDLLNFGTYLQGEISPIEKMKLVAGLRYDQFTYDYRNNLGEDAFSGAPDAKNTFKAITPRVGITYDFTGKSGVYANYSHGFAPPQVGELYRGVKVPTLAPAIYDNYEAGAWINLFKDKLALDVAYYVLRGKDEIISVKQDDGATVNKNAGETLHRGLEYGVQYLPTESIAIRWSGAISTHEYVDFVEKGKDYSDNTMAGAPPVISNAEIKLRPTFLENSLLAVEWQHLSPYYMDAENTAKYNGYNIFNIRLGYQFKGVDVWMHILNVGDTLYATSASRSRWGDSYRLGDPRTFNVGVGYTFK